jgi:hypothetical protein
MLVVCLRSVRLSGEIEVVRNDAADSGSRGWCQSASRVAKNRPRLLAFSEFFWTRPDYDSCILMKRSLSVFITYRLFFNDVFYIL